MPFVCVCVFVFMTLSFYSFIICSKVLVKLVNIMNATKNFFRIPKFLHFLDKSQVSKSFQDHHYIVVNFKF